REPKFQGLCPSGRPQIIEVSVPVFAYIFFCRARILSSSHLAAEIFHLRFKQRFTFFDVQLLRFALLFPLISQVRLLSACPSSLSQNLWKDAKIKPSAEPSRRTPLNRIGVAQSTTKRPG